MAVITISREFGSEDADITKKIADALGYHVADKVVIGRILAQYGLIEFGKEYDTPKKFWDLFGSEKGKRKEDIVRMLNKAILALAHHGNIVIVGRCGFSVLNEYDDVFNIRIQAPFQRRVSNVMKQYSITDKSKAEAMVKEGEVIRTAFIETSYNVRGDLAKSFDLVINAGKVPVNLAIDMIVGSVRELEQAGKGEGKLTETIEVDPVLGAAITEEIHCTIKHARAS
jgi:cytidylate kinase